MDPPNVREAIREALADVDEGADMVMVKPGLPYLDVIRAVRERVDVPVVAYQVSGEFAMLHAAAERGWIDLPRAMMETAHRAAPRRRRPPHHLLRARAGRGARPRPTRPPRSPRADDADTAPPPPPPGSSARRRVTPGGVHSPVRAFKAMGCDAARRSSRRAARDVRDADRPATTSTGSAPGDRRCSATRIRAVEAAVVAAARRGLRVRPRVAAGGRPGRAHRRARARLRDGAVRRHRHRSHDERGARGARGHRAAA